MDLSKTYDFLPHDLLVAKPGTCGFGSMALALITDYLANSNLQTCYLDG